MGIYGEEKMRELQKKFLRGIFTEKVFGESFWKVLQKVLQEKFNGGKKFYGGNGEPGLN